MLINRRENIDEVTNENLFQPKLIKLTEHYESVLKKCGVKLSDPQQMYIWQRLKFNNTTYTSLLSPETKSADFFIEMKDGSLGTAEFFFELNEICFVFLNFYKVTYIHYHLREVSNLNISSVFSCSNIKKKVLYLKCNNIEYISDASLLNFQ